jgi:hypothetical protein
MEQISGQPTWEDIQRICESTITSRGEGMGLAWKNMPVRQMRLMNPWYSRVKWRGRQGLAGWLIERCWGIMKLIEVSISQMNDIMIVRKQEILCLTMNSTDIARLPTIEQPSLSSSLFENWPGNDRRRNSEHLRGSETTLKSTIQLRVNSFLLCSPEMLASHRIAEPLFNRFRPSQSGPPRLWPEKWRSTDSGFIQRFWDQPNRIEINSRPETSHRSLVWTDLFNSIQYMILIIPNSRMSDCACQILSKLFRWLSKIVSTHQFISRQFLDFHQRHTDIYQLTFVHTHLLIFMTDILFNDWSVRLSFIVCETFPQ